MDETISRMALLIPSLLIALAPYFVWPSKWNVMAHMSFGLSVPYFILPILWPGLIQEIDADWIPLYAEIMFVGLAFYIPSLFLGFRMNSAFFQWLFRPPSDGDGALSTAQTRNLICLAFGCVFMVVSFAVMGFVPIFTENPFQAKFLRGDYQGNYDRVAFLYRGGMNTIVATCAFAYVVGICKIKPLHLFFAVVGSLLLVATLSRASLGTVLILVLAPLLLRMKRGLSAFLVVLVFICSAGALLNVPIRVLLGDASFSALVSYDEITKSFAEGAPDYADTLKFLDCFVPTSEWTYGRTFFGGLVPYRYKWNPSVYSLSVLMYGGVGGEVSDLESGGLRLPFPVWGFASYSFLGVIMTSVLVGLIRGNILAASMKTFRKEGTLNIALSTMLTVFIGEFFWSPHLLALYSLPPLFIWLAISKMLKKR